MAFLGMKTSVKLNCLKLFVKKAKAKLYISIENFKMYQLGEELDPPKVQLKSDNHDIILHKTGHNLIKNGPILILFTFHKRYPK
jgi:hypothetical protein